MWRNARFLLPNTALFVCIKSSFSDVKVDFIGSMVSVGIESFHFPVEDTNMNSSCIVQTMWLIDSVDILQFVTQGSTRLPVIEKYAITVESITSKEYMPAKDGVIVLRRVPSNIFAFAAGKSISITKEIYMKLVGSDCRLRVNIDGANNAVENKIASYLSSMWLLSK